MINKRVKGQILNIVPPIGVFVIWELLVYLSILDYRFFPAPSTLIVTFYKLLLSGEIFVHVSVSITRVIIGFALGTFPAILVGFTMGLSQWTRIVVNSIVSITYPIPKIAILPLILFTFGLGETSKYTIVAIGAFFPILLNTFTGVQEVDQVYIDVAYSFKASKVKMIRTVVLPAAAPLVFAGVRLGWGVALLVIVAAEFVGANKGIGYLIWNSWQTFSIKEMYVGLIIIAFLGWLSFICLDILENYSLPWRRLSAQNKFKKRFKRIL